MNTITTIIKARSVLVEVEAAAASRSSNRNGSAVAPTADDSSRAVPHCSAVEPEAHDVGFRGRRQSVGRQPDQDGDREGDRGLHPGGLVHPSVNAKEWPSGLRDSLSPRARE